MVTEATKVVRQMSGSCDNVDRKLLESCPNVVRKLLKYLPEVAKKLPESCPEVALKLTGSCLKVALKLPRDANTEMVTKIVPVRTMNTPIGAFCREFLQLVVSSGCQTTEPLQVGDEPLLASLGCQTSRPSQVGDHFWRP